MFLMIFKDASELCQFNDPITLENKAYYYYYYVHAHIL